MYQRFQASIPAKMCSGIASSQREFLCAAAGKYLSNFQLWICLSANTTTLAHLNLTTMCFPDYSWCASLPTGSRSEAGRVQQRHLRCRVPLGTQKRSIFNEQVNL